jgi:hypothetical protein
MAVGDDPRDGADLSDLIHRRAPLLWVRLALPPPLDTLDTSESRPRFPTGTA